MENAPSTAAEMPHSVRWFTPWSWRRRWWVAAGLLLFFVGYPLSIGPAYGLLVRGWLSPFAYSALYQPLIWCVNLHPALQDLLRWYALLFLG
jgi:hypothetical protein